MKRQKHSLEKECFKKQEGEVGGGGGREKGKEQFFCTNYYCSVTYNYAYSPYMPKTNKKTKD